MVQPNEASASDAPAAGAYRLSHLYRQGIAGCRARKARQVGRVLLELIGTLNFEYEEAATRLFEVYDDCLQRVSRREFEVPLRTFERLSTAWPPALARQGRA